MNKLNNNGTVSSYNYKRVIEKIRMKYYLINIYLHKQYKMIL